MIMITIACDMQLRTWVIMDLGGIIFSLVDNVALIHGA